MADDKRRSPNAAEEPAPVVFQSPAGVRDIYADGYAGIMAGSVTKVGLYSVTGSEKGAEQREVFARLAMPTSALAEFCVMFLRVLKENRVEGLDQLLAQISFEAPKPEHVGKQ